MPSAPPEPPTIDAVVLWVDGDDPAHRDKLAAHLAAMGLPQRPRAAIPTRFRSVGEIDYCVLSILRFAPFIRRIHVITDEQVPPIFQAAQGWPALQRDKLVRVDHRQVFAGHESCLPTFNCRPIETVMHRAPGLAEHFVYFNDDFMLIKPVTPQDFFDQGRPVLRGAMDTMPEHRLSRRLRDAWRQLRGQPSHTLRASNGDAQALAARTVGARRRFFRVGHNPYPMRRSTFERYFADHPEVLARNLVHRLRDASQFAPQALANHLEIDAGQAVLRPDDQCLNIRPATTPRLAQRLQAAAADARLRFACLQNLDLATPEVQQQVLDWLDGLIGPAPAASPASPASN